MSRTGELMDYIGQIPAHEDPSDLLNQPLASDLGGIRRLIVFTSNPEALSDGFYYLHFLPNIHHMTPRPYKLYSELSYNKFPQVLHPYIPLGSKYRPFLNWVYRR